MKRTPLYDLHVEAGARMVEFAGYEMPVQYTSILEEHSAVRTAAGIFDISHMGEFTVMGPAAEEYLASLIPTDMAKLEPGKCMYTLFCKEDGGVIDDLFIFMIQRGYYYLVVNASTAQKDLEWMQSHIIEGAGVVDVSPITSKIDLQGPLSKGIMMEIFDTGKIRGLERFHFCHDTFAGMDVMISATGYTGEWGYELFIDNEGAAGLWQCIMSAGAECGLRQCGLGCRDTLRLESCYSLYGHEINESINPVEAGLGWLVSSGADFTGRGVLMRLKKGGAAREQVCIELTDRGIPRDGCRVVHDESDIGYVTSGVYSPTFKKGLALALVVKGLVAENDIIDVIIRDKPVKGRIVKRPFYRFNG